MSKSKPPELFNTEAESSLIGAALLDGPNVLQLPNVKTVQPADFWDHTHGEIWAAITAVAGKGIEPDVVTVADELQRREHLDKVGGAATLTQAVNICPSCVRADSYAQTVIGWARQRKARDAVYRLMPTFGQDGTFDRALSETAVALVDIAAKSGIEPQGANLWEFRTLADAYAPRDPLEFAIEGLFPMPSLNIVYGSPGCLKSLLLADAAICVAAGRPWLEPLPGSVEMTARKTLTVPVMWLDFDNGRRRTDERMEALARARDLEPAETPLFYAVMPSPWLNGNDQESIDALIEKVKAMLVGFVVIDNLGTVSGGVDENSADMIQVLSNFRRVAEMTGAAVVLIHHQRKSGGFSGRASEALRGHSSIAAALDLSLSVEREENAPEVTVLSTKTRDVDVEPFGAIFTYEHKPGTTELARTRFWGKTVETKTSIATKAILDVVKGSPGINKTQLTQEAQGIVGDDVGVNYVRKTIDRLVEEDRLVAQKGDHNATLYYPESYSFTQFYTEGVKPS